MHSLSHWIENNRKSRTDDFPSTPSVLSLTWIAVEIQLRWKWLWPFLHKNFTLWLFNNINKSKSLVRDVSCVSNVSEIEFVFFYITVNNNENFDLMTQSNILTSQEAGKNSASSDKPLQISESILHKEKKINQEKVSRRYVNGMSF